MKISATIPRPIAIPQLALWAAGLLSCWFLAVAVAQDNYRQVLVAFLAFQAIWIGLRWRASVYFFIAYVAVEGFVLNVFHTVPSLNLVKDLLAISLLAVALAKLALRRAEASLPVRPWVPAFLAFSAIYVAAVFNPALPNLLVGLVGVRATLLFAVLAPVAYWFFETRERVMQFCTFLVYLSAPVSIFGILQSILGPAWVISISPGFSRAVYYAFGNSGRMDNAYFRTFSTFVQTGSFSLFLYLTLLLTFALWVTPTGRKRRPTLAVLFGLQFWAFLTTGGRSPFILLLISIAVLLLTSAVARRFLPLVAVAPVVLWGISAVSGSSILGFQERYTTILDFEYVVQRNSPLVSGWLSEAMQSDALGLGAGYASVASRHVGDTPLNQSVVENSLAKIRFEAGLPGLVLYILFILCILAECVIAPRRVRDSELRWITTAFAVFVGFTTILVIAGTPFEVSPTNTYLWFFLGLLARAPRLDALEVPPTSTHGNQ